MPGPGAEGLLWLLLATELMFASSPLVLDSAWVPQIFSPAFQAVGVDVTFSPPLSLFVAVRACVCVYLHRGGVPPLAKQRAH